jgi:DNA-binding GntR family transcriptional regulator
VSLFEKNSLPDHGQRRQAIVGSLLRDVFRGHFQAGQHLVTRELADRFGVSHTPIREALISLAGIGVVDLLPNRGAVVRRITPRIIAEICQVRCVLECEAVRSACGRIDRSSLETLARELQFTVSQRADEPRFVEQARAIDSRLHDLIAASCGNAFLAGELTRLKSLFRAFRDLSWEFEEARNDYHRIAEEATEHLAIVDALLSEKRLDAVRAMSRHISSGIHYWSRSVEEPAIPHSAISNPQLNLS